MGPWPRITDVFSGVSVIVICVVVMVKCNMDVNNKKFKLFRLSDMDDKMPPLNPVSPISCQMDCAMLCLDDVTCAAFSYSEFIKFCMMTPELIRQYDVDISLNLPGFVHFNLFEDITKSLLPPGYRTFSIPDLALRFHYYWPKNWTDARDTCTSEGGRLLTLDTEQKRLLLKELVTGNKVLSATGLGLYVGGMNNGTDFFWQNGAQLDNSDPLWATSGPTGSGNCTMLQKDKDFKLVDFNCTIEQPYVCEHLYFETPSPVPLFGSFSLN